MRSMSPVETDPAEDATEHHPVFSATPFGKYVLVRLLAAGGMAEIFLAKQTGVEDFERNVVIKRMLAHLSRQDEFVRMFLDEARLAARLTHPNIIPIYDLGQADGSYFICMEYLPGEDLAWLLRQARARNRPLPLAIAVRIVIDAARGLHYAHEFCDEQGKLMHIVHRDISPSNIYITYEGQVKVLDFGIAKAESRVSSTNVGTVKGKAMYMSPEQSRAEPVDRRCDIYSLGVTLYEALTNSRPFMRDSAQEMMHAVLRGDYEAPRKRRPDIPEELERIVLKAMALEVADRFATAAELADALEDTLENTTPAGQGASVGRFLRDLFGEEQVAQRTRIPTLATIKAQPRPHVRKEEHPSPPSPRRWRVLGIVVAACLMLAGAAVVIGYRQRHAVVAPPPGCAQRFGSDAPDAIVIGAALPLSFDGKLDQEGQQQLLNAARLALDEINQRDGVAGRHFALLVCDNGADTARIKGQVTWLVKEQKIPALITSWSAHTLASVNVTIPSGVVTITGEATSPELAAVPSTAENGARLLWRTAPSDTTVGHLIPQILAHDPAFSGVKRVGLIYQDDPYGQGLASVIAAGLPMMTPPLAVNAIQYPFRGDVASAIDQLAAAKPDVTVVVGFPFDVVRLLNQAARQSSLQRAHGHRWFFSDASRERDMFAGLDHPEEIDGSYGMESTDGGGIEATAFQARFRARFLRDAQDQTYAANRYDAIYLLALGAAYAAGKDGSGAITGTRIAAGMMHLSSGPKFSLAPDQFTAAKAVLQSGRSIDVDGASGTLDFDQATGEPPASFRLWRIQGKRFIHERNLEWHGPSK
jgi:serine/threonine-protein kinase